MVTCSRSLGIYVLYYVSALSGNAGSCRVAMSREPVGFIKKVLDPIPRLRDGL